MKALKTLVLSAALFSFSIPAHATDRNDNYNKPPASAISVDSFKALARNSTQQLFSITVHRAAKKNPAGLADLIRKAPNKQKFPAQFDHAYIQSVSQKTHIAELVIECQSGLSGIVVYDKTSKTYCDQNFECQSILAASVENICNGA